VWAADPEEGKLEATVFGGGTRYGQQLGTHAIVGGAFGVNANHHLQLFGEFSYVPLGSATASYSGVSASASEKMLDFGGGVLASFGGSRVRPYVLGAFGDGHDSVAGTGSAAGYSVSVSTSANSVYAAVGGGARVFLGQSWGLRPEFRYQRYLQNGGLNVATFTMGFFFGFGK